MMMNSALVYNASKNECVYIKDLMKLNMQLFLSEDTELLGKYNEIWSRVSNTIKKGFESEPVYSEKHFKTKAKSSEGNINTNFHNDKMRKKEILIVFVHQWY